jgi:TonB family protein
MKSLVKIKLTVFIAAFFVFCSICQGAAWQGPWTDLGSGIFVQVEQVTKTVWTWRFKNQSSRRLMSMDYRYIDSEGEHKDSMGWHLNPGASHGGWSDYTASSRPSFIVDNLEWEGDRERLEAKRAAEERSRAEQRAAEEQRQRQLEAQRIQLETQRREREQERLAQERRVAELQRQQNERARQDAEAMLQRARQRQQSIIDAYDRQQRSLQNAQQATSDAIGAIGDAILDALAKKDAREAASRAAQEEADAREEVERAERELQQLRARQRETELANQRTTIEESRRQTSAPDRKPDSGPARVIATNQNSLLQKAQSGDAEAQYGLAQQYKFEIARTNATLQQALFWFTKAAQQGHMGAQRNLGYMYLNGEGVEINVPVARTWFEKASAQGDLTSAGELQQKPFVTQRREQAGITAAYTKGKSAATSSAPQRTLDFGTCTRPEYPTAEKRMEATGVVTLAFLVNWDGTVADSKIMKSSGFVGLDEAARSALAKCRFSPTTTGSKKQQWQPVQYVFTLE